jgi:hypothetical protein
MDLTLRITRFLDFFPSSGNVENRKHDVSEAVSVSFIKWGEDTYSVIEVKGTQLSRCLLPT